MKNYFSQEVITFHGLRLPEKGFLANINAIPEEELDEFVEKEKRNL